VKVYHYQEKLQVADLSKHWFLGEVVFTLAALLTSRTKQMRTKLINGKGRYVQKRYSANVIVLRFSLASYVLPGPFPPLRALLATYWLLMCFNKQWRTGDPRRGSHQHTGFILRVLPRLQAGQQGRLLRHLRPLPGDLQVCDFLHLCCTLTSALVLPDGII
jgi:hypothetical protein